MYINTPIEDICAVPALKYRPQAITSRGSQWGRTGYRRWPRRAIGLAGTMDPRLTVFNVLLHCWERYQYPTQTQSMN